MSANKFQYDLYHYTTCESLFGMLQDYSKDNPYLTMWATHYAFMNDSSEYEWGRQLVREGMTICENTNAIVEEQSFSNLPESDIDKFWENNPLFIISLSKNKANASMWDMYADGGKGIALVFRKSLFRSGETSSNSIVKCEYCKSCKDILGPISFIHQIQKNIANQGDKQYTTINPNMALQGLPYYIKHKAFEHEEEYRMAVKHEMDETVKYRVKNGIIVPYIEKMIPITDISGIIVGPTADFERVRKSLQMYFTSKGGHLKKLCNSITKSDIPYKG